MDEGREILLLRLVQDGDDPAQTIGRQAHAAGFRRSPALASTTRP